MSGGVHDPLITSKIKPPSPRGTGIVFTAVALIVAVIFRRNAPVWIGACGVAAVFAILTVAKPALLGPLNRAWFKLSQLINRIVNPIVMLLMFVVAFVPMGFLMRMWRDPLLRRRQPEAKSYWVVRERSPAGHSMKNQF